MTSSEDSATEELWSGAAREHNLLAVSRAALTRSEAVVLDVTQGVPTLFFRRQAYEKAGLARAELDARLGLTDAEFRVDGELLALGPIYDVDALGALLDELEGAGLTYFEDYFELSGTWPEWLAVAVRAAGSARVTAAS